MAVAAGQPEENRGVTRGLASAHTRLAAAAAGTKATAAHGPGGHRQRRHDARKHGRRLAKGRKREGERGAHRGRRRQDDHGEAAGGGTGGDGTASPMVSGAREEADGRRLHHGMEVEVLGRTGQRHGRPERKMREEGLTVAREIRRPVSFRRWEATTEVLLGAAQRVAEVARAVTSAATAACGWRRFKVVAARVRGGMVVPAAHGEAKPKEPTAWRGSGYGDGGVQPEFAGGRRRAERRGESEVESAGLGKHGEMDEGSTGVVYIGSGGRKGAGTRQIWAATAGRMGWRRREKAVDLAPVLAGKAGEVGEDEVGNRYHALVGWGGAREARRRGAKPEAMAAVGATGGWGRR
uniref:Uncharacterized protein n=1 Tax=Oryza sativa subsp. japonica TaxID=39947 RepID=Q6K2C3_ORYSJ|nr:hypothetical protein [Oryza sativa Japonica Group]BAD23693.1 hypothetical protein [Oryza sativa Japonica Group]